MCIVDTYGYCILWCCCLRVVADHHQRWSKRCPMCSKNGVNCRRLQRSVVSALFEYAESTRWANVRQTLRALSKLQFLVFVFTASHYVLCAIICSIPCRNAGQMVAAEASARCSKTFWGPAPARHAVRLDGRSVPRRRPPAAATSEPVCMCVG